MKLIFENMKNAIEPNRAEISSKFFKTQKGSYGEGDIFWGIRNGELRKIAKKHKNRINLLEVKRMLNCVVHEKRLVAILILVEKYETGSTKDKEKIFNFYLKNARFVNSWDLVDLSSWKIIGNWLVANGDDNLLNKLAISGNLWERRIAMVATFAFIRKGKFQPTLKIARLLLGDSHDLIHKSSGWMLREVGKKNKKLLENFLGENYSSLHRTTLRYAIERFSDKERKYWLDNKISKNYNRNLS